MLPMWTLPLRGIAILCALLLVHGDVAAFPQSDQADTSGGTLPPDQLDSLVAPIALYPDPLLAQVLAASTYPMEVHEANIWVQQNSGLKGEALVSAAAKQDWEASIQALVPFPDVLRRMDEDLRWTTNLGNAFLAQESDVMAAVQRMRQKAYAAGAIPSNAQQNVQVQTVEGSKVIVIQPANPQVVYVPTYNPVVVYGPPPVYAPYPVLAYPAAPTGAVVAASMIAFGAGIALGSYFRGYSGGWGWGCAWGPRPTLYVNNVFVNRYGYRSVGVAGVNGRATWSHNSYYRRGTPYSNATVARRYNSYGAAGSVRTPNGAAGAVRTPNGAAGAVRTPNGAAGAVRTPNGAAGAVRTPNGAAGAARTPNGAAGAVRTPNGAAGAVRTPNGAAGAVRTPNGVAGAVRTPNGAAGAVRTPNGAAVRTPSGTATRAKPAAPATRSPAPARSAPSQRPGNSARPARGGGAGQQQDQR